MAEYLVQDTDMAVVADAIRAKGGTSELLTFPDGMAQAVEAITGGGGVPGDTTMDDFLSRSTIIVNSTAKGLRIEAMKGLRGITKIVLKSVTNTGGSSLREMNELLTVDLYKLEMIGQFMFYNSVRLETLIIRTPTLCRMGNVDDLYRTKIAKKEGYIYVPKNLVEQYKVATNWAKYADQIRAIEDYPEITGGAK